MPNLEIVEVVLVHRNIANNEYQHHLRILHTFVYICTNIYIYIYIYIYHLVNCWIFHPKTL